MSRATDTASHLMREELRRRENQRRCCAKAEIAGISRVSGQGEGTLMRWQLSEQADAEHLAGLLARQLGATAQAAATADGWLVHSSAENLAERCGLRDRHGTAIQGMAPWVMSARSCCAGSALSGMLLAGGRIEGGGRGAVRLRVPCTSETGMAAGALARRIGAGTGWDEQGLLARSGQVHALLLTLGCAQTAAALDAMDQSRDRPAVRTASLVDANQARSVEAGAAQADACSRVLTRAGQPGGFQVPDHLRDAAELRIAWPGASLEQLGQMSVPVLSKDAIAGRIRRLLALGEDTKAG